jgi:hypothetical protein
MRALLTAMFVLAGSGLSHGQADSWRASSDTATSVTGDIRFETDRIVFANGATLRLVPVESRIGVFKVDPPANPRLVNGNRLCGAKDLTYVVLAQGSDSSLSMKVFDGPEAPTEALANPLPQVGTCATFEFSR